MNGVEGPGLMGFQPSAFEFTAGHPAWLPYARAFVQAAMAVPVFGIALWRVRHNRNIRTFVVGLATLTFAWFALRTLH